jgi:hypothetical protein
MSSFQENWLIMNIWLRFQFSFILDQDERSAAELCLLISSLGCRKYGFSFHDSISLTCTPTTWHVLKFFIGKRFTNIMSIWIGYIKRNAYIFRIIMPENIKKVFFLEWYLLAGWHMFNVSLLRTKEEYD